MVHALIVRVSYDARYLAFRRATNRRTGDDAQVQLDMRALSLAALWLEQLGEAPARTFDRSDGVRTQRRAAVLLVVGYPSDCRAQVLTRGSAVAPLIYRLADAHPWGDIGVFKHPRQDRQREEEHGEHHDSKC